MAKIQTAEWLKTDHKFCCPVCGAKSVEDSGRPLEKCAHFLFSWESTYGDFIETSDSIDQMLEKADTSFDPLDPRLLSQLPESTIVHRLETRDHACGPVVRTDVIAFDTAVQHP